MDYLKMTKLAEQRRLNRYALTGRNGGDPEREPEPESDVTLIRKSTERVRVACDRLFKSIDEALS